MKAIVNGWGKIRVSILVAVAVLSVQASAVNVLMQHNDLARTGANTAETILTPTNVVTSFGRLFTNSVDAQVYAQPLYVQNLSISGGVHNVVFVCTESNSVYAFDADIPGVTYWHDKFGTPFGAPCMDLTPVIGISGTPVIDPDSGTIYLDTKLQIGPAHQLHALDITTGSEKFGGPVTITNFGFAASLEHQRLGLLLLSNVVYVGFGSHCDQGTYHGFLMGYNATNLSAGPVYRFNATPTGTQGAIWCGGMAPAVDTNGNIYVMTGNGSFDGTTNFSMSFLKLSPSLTVEDYATPTDWSTLSGADLDLGSGGPVLLPPHYIVGIGKQTNLYLADINNMGHVGNFVQVFGAVTEGDTVGKSPVYWQGPSMQYLFLAHASSPTRSFQFTGSSIVTTPLGTSSFTASDRVGGLSLSANGTTNGVLWEIGSDNRLRAYDAVNFPNLLWSGLIGTYVKMTCPTIANGKVYVATANNLIVFGLTNYLYLQSGAPTPVLSWASGGTLLESTDLLNGPWTSVTNGPPFMIVPTNDQMFYELLLP